MIDRAPANSLFAVTFTLAVFVIARAIYRKAGGPALLNPVLISIATTAVCLKAFEIPYDDYFQGAQILHFLLGPAVVGLAVPLHRHSSKIAKTGPAVAASVFSGLAAGAPIVMATCAILHIDRALMASLLTRSVTAPVAIAISGSIGGIPTLAAVFAVMSGTFGAAFGPALLDALGVKGNAARGLAMGTASHGIGTARMLQESEEAGAFSGLAMALAAAGVAFSLPLLLRL